MQSLPKPPSRIAPEKFALALSSKDRKSSPHDDTRWRWKKTSQNHPCLFCATTSNLGLKCNASSFCVSAVKFPHWKKGGKTPRPDTTSSIHVDGYHRLGSLLSFKLVWYHLLHWLKGGEKAVKSLTIPNTSWTEVTFKGVRWRGYSNGRSAASLSVPHAEAGSPTLLALCYTTAERSAVSFSHTCCFTAGGMRDEWVERGRQGGRGWQGAEPRSERRIAADKLRVPAGTWREPGPVLLGPVCVCVWERREKEMRKVRVPDTAQPQRTCAGKCGLVCEQAARVWKCDGVCVCSLPRSPLFTVHYRECWLHASHTLPYSLPPSLSLSHFLSLKTHIHFCFTYTLDPSLSLPSGSCPPTQLSLKSLPRFLQINVTDIFFIISWGPCMADSGRVRARHWLKETNWAHQRCTQSSDKDLKQPWHCLTQKLHANLESDVAIHASLSLFIQPYAKRTQSSLR